MGVIAFSGAKHDHLSLHLHLAKDDRRRRFWVRRLDYRDGYWKGQIWFDGRTHRQVITNDLHELSQFRSQCVDEVAELLKDGWVKIAATQPNSARWAR
jgi:hypothetical protein